MSNKKPPTFLTLTPYEWLGFVVYIATIATLERISHIAADLMLSVLAAYTVVPLVRRKANEFYEDYYKDDDRDA